MKKWILRITVLVALFSILPITVLSADADKENFDWGFDLRLRYEYWKNVFDFNSDGSRPEDSMLRIKAILWAQYIFNDTISMNVKFGGEPRYYFGPHIGEEFTLDELLFDNLYVDIKSPGDLPIDFRIGRQDFLFTYGEGFLIMDGTPFDGSRSYYFNAAKASWKINKKNSLDLVYIIDPRSEQFLPILNKMDPETRLNYSDEQGVVVYGKSQLTEKLSLEPYYMYKLEEAVDASSYDLDLHTFGARGVMKSDPWRLRGELAYQFGEYDNNVDRDGLGGYIFTDYKMNQWMPLCPEWTIGASYLSGDDPDTPKVEEWNPLFSRWPWMSELYLLSYATEKKIPGYWTNLQLYRIATKLTLDPKTTLELRYNYLRANEDANITGSVFSNDGKERGHLPQVQLNHQFSKNIKGYILVEYLVPGDYYIDTADDAMFIRTELSFRF